MSVHEDPWDVYAPEAGDDHAGYVFVETGPPARLTPDDARAMAADLLERAAYAESVAAEAADDGGWRLLMDARGRWFCDDCDWTSVPGAFIAEAESQHATYAGCEAGR